MFAVAAAAFRRGQQMKKSRFGIIPGGIGSNPDISPRALKILCHLSEYIDKQGWCARKQSRIADEVGMHRQRVNEALKELEALGYVEKQNMYRDDGGRASSRYRIVFDTHDDVTDADFADEVEEEEPKSAVNETGTSSSSDRGACPDIGQAPVRRMSGHPLSGPEADSNNSPLLKDSPHKPPKGDVGFEEWYSAYPRKAGRIAAAKAFSKAIALIDLPTLLARTRIFAEKWAQLPSSDLRFCPHPATWLNQGRWDDEDLQNSATRASGNGGGYVVDEARRRQLAMDTGVWYEAWQTPPDDIQALIDAGQIKITEHGRTAPSTAPQEA